jgi:hypothetical protein
VNAWKWLGLVALAAVSALIFTWYQRPDMVLSAGNAFLALCGFK